MTDFPGRNPLPTLAVAGADEISPPDAQRAWAESTPTVILPAVAEARRRIENYLRSPGEGGLGWLHGAEGAGKTHTALHLLAHARRAAPEAVQIYLPFQAQDFTAAYRPLVTQVSPRLLAELSLRHLSVIAAELAGPDRQEEVLSSVSVQPHLVFDYFDRHEIEEGRVQERQLAEIARSTGGDAPQFQRALHYLLRPEWHEAAYDWLSGRPVDAGACRAIGVRGPIRDALTCRYGLQLLAALAKGAGRPFILVLDRCDRFLLDSDRPVPANAGLLQHLTEQIPKAGGMLFLMSHERAWEHMPPDLQRRIGGHAYRIPALTPDDARRVLSSYLGLTGTRGDGGIRPFTDDGLRELLCRSGGNLRRLLRLGGESFEAPATTGGVDAGAVATATAGRGGFQDVAQLATFVEKRLRRTGLSCRRIEQADGTVSLLLPARQAPQAVITVSDACFRYDERIRRAATVPASYGRVSFHALVFRGYASPEVLDALGTADTSLAADGSPEFETGLDALFEKLRPLGSGEETPVMVTEPVTSQTPSEWQKRRAHLEQRILEVRAAREAADLKEFGEAWAEEADRGTTRFLVRTVLVVSALAMAAALAPPALSWKLLLALAIGLAAGCFTWTRLRRAKAPPKFRRQLDRFARELTGETAADSSDPLHRYVWALRADPDEDFQQLVDRMPHEPVAVVRQAIGNRLALTRRPLADCVTLIPRDWQRVPELLLLLAREQPSQELDRSNRPLRELPPELRVLVALANRHAPALTSARTNSIPAERALEALGTHNPHHPLARAYNGDQKMGQLTWSPSELRATARLLSPWETNGLGTYDWLPVVRSIDDLYLFFEELIHRQEETVRTYRKLDSAPDS